MHSAVGTLMGIMDGSGDPARRRARAMPVAPPPRGLQNQFGLQDRADAASQMIVLGVQQGISSLPPTSGQAFTYDYNAELGTFVESEQLGPTVLRSTQTIGAKRLSLRFATSYFELGETFDPIFYTADTLPESFTLFGMSANADVVSFNAAATYGFTDRIEATINIPFSVVQAKASQTFLTHATAVSAAEPGGGARSSPCLARPGETGPQTVRAALNADAVALRELSFTALGADFNTGKSVGLGRISVGAKGVLLANDWGELAASGEFFCNSPSQAEFAGSNSPSILPRVIGQVHAAKRLNLHADAGYEYDFDVDELSRFVWNAGLSVPIVNATFDLGVGGSLFDESIKWTPVTATGRTMAGRHASPDGTRCRSDRAGHELRRLPVRHEGAAVRSGGPRRRGERAGHQRRLPRRRDRDGVVRVLLQGDLMMPVDHDDARGRLSARIPARGRRARAIVASLAAAIVLTASGAASAQCEGDCNDDGSVSISELILAVRIALGGATAAECSAVDADDNGAVNINELVAAVTRALGSCSGTLEEELRASVSATIDPIFQIIVLGSAGAGGGAGITSALAPASARATTAGFSGCQTFDCLLFGEFTGTEFVCCEDNQYSLSTTGCTFDDGAGNIIERSGSVILFSDDPGVCSGSVPPGTSFELDYDTFYFQITDPDSNYVITVSDLTETFDAVASGCAGSQPDQFGLGIRGDGFRSLQGGERRIVGNSDGVSQDTAAFYDAVDVTTASLEESEGCSVGAQLDGEIDSADFLSGAQFFTEYSEFRIVQVPRDDTLYVGLEGTFFSDCLGDVTVATLEPLQITPDNPCITGGLLQTELEGGSSIIGYTPDGGLELDFGADGSVDERFDSCQEIPALDECTLEQSPDLCRPCSDSETCPEDLICYTCAFNCQGDTDRCSDPNSYVACEDGIF